MRKNRGFVLHPACDNNHIMFIEMLKMKTQYIVNQDNEYVYSVESDGNPFSSVEVAPTGYVEGVNAAFWETDVLQAELRFGEAGTGQWMYKRDYRKKDLYDKSTGAKFTLSEETFNGLGDLPGHLTENAPNVPTPCHWDGMKWVAVEPKKIIPRIVSKAAGNIVLNRRGHYWPLINHLNSVNEQSPIEEQQLKLAFDGVQNYDRDSPNFKVFADILKLTEKDLDALFLEASVEIL